MKSILITGATGFIGQELAQKLNALGHPLKIVTRDINSAKKKIYFKAEFIQCDLNSEAVKTEDFENVSCVIHLAGESIDGRWTAKKKADILNSRVYSSENILKNMPASVSTILSTSAQGIYAESLDQWLDENAPQGSGFLADVCKKWELPFVQLAATSTKRIAIFRLGLVVSQKGGALKKMLPIFKKNLGAALGSGQQWVSWIHLEDVCQVFINAVHDDNYKGHINLVTENPVTNLEWTEVLCKALNAFQLPKVPSFVLKAGFGEMSSILLASLKLQPSKLKQLKYKFKFENIKSAFAYEIQSGL